MPNGDNSLNVVLSRMSNLKQREIYLMAGLSRLWREAKFLIIFHNVCEIKSPFATQKFHLLQRRLFQCRIQELKAL